MKRLLSLSLLLLPLLLSAQIQFGYLSYQSVMQEMPEYAQAKANLATLKAKYEAESARGEEEFQRKFVDYLQGQKDFPQTIMQKRQAELQSLMDNGVSFRVQAQSLIANAEKEMMAEVSRKLNSVILEVGVEYGYGFILNTDDNSCPYINPVIGIDVTELVRRKLGLAENETVAPVVPATPSAPAENVLTPSN